ncbi:phage portal protein [Lederbergia sp. NSJ-179]|uniref:phage portal protein n=1 Tax=Lederbergia sp. NSJ-179 TaxID=2931402 RepID=UPI001FD0A720|nr:phage portal protein [Lederbergia sp. NSJ-179]MCJ7841763.1 phage portal protein [Lederbergia sp. NSJ-179]
MDLEQYIKIKHDNDPHWFFEEIGTVSNQQRIQKILDNKDYLEGNHKILKRPNYIYNGETVESRRIVLQTAKTLLQFQVEYLLKNEIQLTGKEKVVDTFATVNKMGRYSFVNKEILDKMLKFGQCAEYVYLDKGKIKSKILDPSEFTAVYNKNNEIMAVVEHFVYDAISYYTIYTENMVQEYSNEGGEIKLVAQYANLSGLPIVYSTQDEYGSIEGRSELEDWKGILDNMEDLLSKTMDATYKAITGIPVTIGQQLKGSLPADIVGGGINLDDGASFSFQANKTDIKSFEKLYDTLNQSLLDISMTPAVSMNKTDISNLSEVSIKLLFSLANVKAGLNESYLKRGLIERYEKIRKLLEYRDVKMTDDEFYSLDFVFTYNQPSNETETINNLKTLREMNAVSMETMLERSPYTTDAIQEMERLNSEGVNVSAESGEEVQ